MTPARSDWGESVRIFAKIGVLNFGGPAAQIALMHRILVDEKAWLDETEFAHALNVCMLLPGPEALQVAIYAGWRRHGLAGGLMSGLFFILPGFVIMLALSAAYAAWRHLGPMAGLFLGIQAATIGIVIEALIKVARRALQTNTHRLIAALSFLALASSAIAYWVVVIAAGLIGYWFLARPKTPALSVMGSVSVPIKRTIQLIAGHGGVWLVALIGLLAVFGPRSVYLDLYLYFSQLSLVAFGGAYAMLSAVTNVAVHEFGWLSPDAMVTGLGLAETTPGPLILVLCFVGFQAAASGGLGAGLLGASITALAIFLPSFLFVLLAAPHLDQLRGRPGLAVALSGITAAVVGVIGHLSVWFGLHFLFRSVETLRPWPQTGMAFAYPDISSLDPLALVLALVCALVLFRTRLGLAGSLGIGAGLGVVARLMLA